MTIKFSKDSQKTENKVQETKDCQNKTGSHIIGKD